MWMFVHRQLSVAAAADLALFCREIYLYCMKLLFLLHLVWSVWKFLRECP